VLPTLPELEDFAATTRATQKKKRRVAAGKTAPPVELRLGDTRLGAARRRTRLGQSLRGALRRTASSAYVVGAPVPAEQLGKRRLITAAALAFTADLIVVPALEDLDIEDLTEGPLRVWLCAVAAGKALVARRDVTPDISAQSPAVLRYQQGTRFPAKARVADEFRHKGLALALSAYAAEPKIKWKVVIGGPTVTASSTSTLSGSFGIVFCRRGSLSPRAGARFLHSRGGGLRAYPPRRRGCAARRWGRRRKLTPIRLGGQRGDRRRRAARPPRGFQRGHRLRPGRRPRRSR
jgi:hypothetical protein